MQTLETELKRIKNITRPAPINEESRFNYDELFFSVTDPKSNITFANQVFIRISKYEKQDIIGQLHKLIRHPDMPRSVFHIFWEYLLENKPVAAYVKNMAQDGSYYWVMALAFPCEGGYLSIRLKPGSPLFEKVKKIYASTLKVEKETAKLTDKKEAMLAGRDHLLSLLKKEGFDNYQEFMWNALQLEITNRENKLSVLRSSSGPKKDHEVSDELIQLEETLGELVASLEKLKQIYEALNSHSDYILKLARSIILLSLNAQVGSAKLNRDDLSISVVAEKMGEQSLSGEEQLLKMKDSIEKLNELIGYLNFDIISSKLQVEMTIDFLKELSIKESHDSTAILSEEKTLRLLHQAYKPRLSGISKALGEVPRSMRELLMGVKSIERFLMVLRFIHITGKVEVARMDNTNNSFATTFQELISEVDNAESHLKELTEVVEKNNETAKMYGFYKDKVSDLSSKLNFEDLY